MIDNKTKTRIISDAKARFEDGQSNAVGIVNATTLSTICQGAYIVGAEAEAERAEEIIEAYRELHSLSNDQLNEMEKHVKGYEPNREKVARAHELLKKIEALNNYNNQVNK